MDHEQDCTKKNEKRQQKHIAGLFAICLLTYLILPASAVTLDELKYSCLGGQTNITTNIINSTINGTGPQGPAGTIDINATFTGDPGTNALVTNIGTSYAAILNFVIPKGDKGDQGVNGTPGPQGVNGTPGTNGMNGINGINGTNATINVNNTFTLPYGQNANVTNVGNLSAASLNFYIPEGQMNQTPNMSSFFVGSTWYDHNVTSPDIPGYFVFNRSFPTGIEGSASVSAMVPGTEYLIKAFASNPGDPSLTYLPAGDRIWTTYAKVSSTVSGDSFLVVRLYKRDLAGIETEMYNGTSEKLETTIDEAMTAITVPVNQPMNLTDRFVAKYYAKTNSLANPTITFYFDDNNHASRVTSPIVQGLQGPQGPAGTITINSTSTGAPGTNASVVNIGNSTQAILDFTIPSGSASINMSAIYPIGSVYITTSNVNPSILLGVGTWERIGQGRVLIGQDDNQSAFNTSLSTGGNYTQNISAHTYGV